MEGIANLPLSLELLRLVLTGCCPWLACVNWCVAFFHSIVFDFLQQMMAGDPEDSTVNCVDAWVSKLLDGKTLAESEVVQLCNKVLRFRSMYRCCKCVLPNRFRSLGFLACLTPLGL